MESDAVRTERKRPTSSPDPNSKKRKTVNEDDDEIVVTSVRNMGVEQTKDGTFDIIVTATYLDGGHTVSTRQPVENFLDRIMENDKNSAVEEGAFVRHDMQIASCNALLASDTFIQCAGH